MIDRAASGQPLLIAASALWLAVALAAIFIGLLRIRQGQRALHAARAVADLFAGAPAVSMLVYDDGSVDADPRCAAWLGLDRVPQDLAALRAAPGLERSDVDALIAAVRSAGCTGRPIEQTMALAGTSRMLRVHGQPYQPYNAGRRAILLWLMDASEQQRETATLRDDAVKLRSALDGLSALVEAAPFPMWHRGSDFALTLVNRAYVRAVDAGSAAEVISRGLELIEEGRGPTPRASAQAARAQAQVATRTAPAIIAGQRRMMRVVDVPIGAAGVAGYAIDIQDLEDARADLALFARAQRAIFDRLSSGVAQFAADRGLVFYNRHFTRLFAMEADWLADRPDFDRVLERMREAQRAPESRDFPAWKVERRRWFATTEPIEENWLLPGGTHLRVVAQPLPDGGLLLIFEDRTENLRLESARDTLLRVRTATFENLFEAIGVFAADGRLHLWNNRFREVWDLAESDLAHQPRVDALAEMIAPKLLDPTRAGVIRDMVRAATVDRQSRSDRISMADGRHFDFAAVPLPDGNALVTLLDITASRGIEEALRDRNAALEEANRLKNAFVSRMSYELRVPMTSIAGFAEMLAHGYAGELPDTAREYVDAILAAVAGLSSITGDALDLTRGAAGLLPMARAAVDVAELVADAVGRHREPARAGGLTIALELAADCGTVAADPGRLAAAIDHLLRNAVRYTPPGGRIVVGARVVDDACEIVVSDDGDGIVPQVRDRIFDRFACAGIAAGGDPAALSPGRGFGLPFARQLVELHGGTLELLSDVGKGKRVIIRLPLSRAAA